MDNVVELAIEKFKQENGEFENGDEFVTVLNDCTLIISFEDDTLGLKFILGKPYVLDLNLGM